MFTYIYICPLVVYSVDNGAHPSARVWGLEAASHGPLVDATFKVSTELDNPMLDMLKKSSDGVPSFVTMSPDVRKYNEERDLIDCE